MEERWESHKELCTHYTLYPTKKHQPRHNYCLDLLFICFPLLLLLRMAPKSLGLLKYTLQEGSLPYQKEILVQSGKIFLEISYWTLFLTLQCLLQLSLISSLLIQDLT